jgi:hypothetical protein
VSADKPGSGTGAQGGGVFWGLGGAVMMSAGRLLPNSSAVHSACDSNAALGARVKR